MTKTDRGSGRSRPLRWRRALPWACLLLAGAAALGAIQRAASAWSAHRANQELAAGVASPGSPPNVVLAQAVAQEQAGRYEDALASYAQAESIGDELVRHAARVNVANLYLRRGIAAARDDGNAQRALVLVQLAKTTYRRALRERPDDWNARYNLELAMRVVPDFEVRNWRRSGNEAEVEEAIKRDKSAWSEMVGQPRGMH